MAAAKGRQKKAVELLQAGLPGPFVVVQAPEPAKPDPVPKPKALVKPFSGAAKKEGVRDIFIHAVKGEYKYSQKYALVAQSVLEAQVELEKIEPFEIPTASHQAWYSSKLHVLRDYLVKFNAAREALLKANLDILQGLEDPGSCDPGAGPHQDEV